MMRLRIRAAFMLKNINGSARPTAKATMNSRKTRPAPSAPNDAVSKTNNTNSAAGAAASRVNRRPVGMISPAWTSIRSIRAAGEARNVGKPV